MLEGEKIYLKPIDYGDEETLYKIVNTEGMEHMNGKIQGITREEARRWVEDIAKDALSSKKEKYSFLAIDKASKTAVGLVLFNINNFKSRYAGIGYGFIPTYRKKGYATEAVRLILEFAFKELNMETVYAGADHNNIASQKTLLKAGFKKEGKIHRKGYLYGQYIDAIYFYMTKRMWLQRSAGND